MKQGVFPSILEETHADETTQPFWDAAKQNRLVAPKCVQCGTFRLPRGYRIELQEIEIRLQAFDEICEVM